MAKKKADATRADPAEFAARIAEAYATDGKALDLGPRPSPVEPFARPRVLSS
jgi:hypothetical protein